mmetsp:Transcript_16630/g.24428  ORF Transcript_16630/g.24428 Transcript_16630/m.24428 type:complete len:118 (+) Transcript_16630:555-908(+)
MINEYIEKTESPPPLNPFRFRLLYNSINPILLLFHICDPYNSWMTRNKGTITILHTLMALRISFFHLIMPPPKKNVKAPSVEVHLLLISAIFTWHSSSIEASGGREERPRASERFLV